ncbi:hypothetical protein CFE70_010097 [Pyrenophora teres f. teres 0-1]
MHSKQAVMGKGPYVVITPKKTPLEIPSYPATRDTLCTTAAGSSSSSSSTYSAANMVPPRIPSARNTRICTPNGRRMAGVRSPQIVPRPAWPDAA